MRWHNVLIGILCVPFFMEMAQFDEQFTIVGIQNGAS
jgi:hypothetical protein